MWLTTRSRLGVRHISFPLRGEYRARIHLPGENGVPTKSDKTEVGIGGEYAAINSTIDELIPARHRGRVDLAINSGYWLGAAGGSLLAVVFRNTIFLAPNVGWRLAFLVGVVLGIAVLLVRRYVPERPRWMFIHGRDREAEKLVVGIEHRQLANLGHLNPTRPQHHDSPPP